MKNDADEHAILQVSLTALPIAFLMKYIYFTFIPFCFSLLIFEKTI